MAAFSGLHTSMPWREWMKFNIVRIHSPTYNAWASAVTAADWDTTRKPFGQIWADVVNGALGEGYFTLFQPSDDFALETSMDNIFTCGTYFIMSLINNTGGATHFRTYWTFLNDPQGDSIDWERVSGKYYNGYSQWSQYPPRTDAIPYSVQKSGLPCLAAAGVTTNCPTFAETPRPYMQWIHGYNSGGDPYEAWSHQDKLFDYGATFRFWDVYHAPNWGFNNGDDISMNFLPQRFKIYYWNCVVNDIQECLLTSELGNAYYIDGLGFHFPEADIIDYCWGFAGVWNDYVVEIDFIGLQGQGTFNLTKIAGDFTLTNARITIPAGKMPALPIGTYEIRLKKQNDELGAGNPYYTYAGDFRSDSDGRCRKGKRFTLNVTVGPCIAKSKDGILLTKWGWKDYNGNQIFKHYAPIDVRAPDKFYEGLILSYSKITRAVDDKTGLFSVSSMNLELSNHKKEFSQLLAQYFCKNQIIEIYTGWPNRPESCRSRIIEAVVDDYSLGGTSFFVQVKDVSQKYFKIRVPFYLCTLDDYPNIPEDSVGRPMPEVLGLNVLTTGEAMGATEAIYINTTTFRYLAARGSLKEISAVYKDGELVDPADYFVEYGHGGRTYIRFTADQETAKITFDAKGYMFAPWNSANGYVQNPVYILLFYLAFIMEIPAQLLDLEAFDTLADRFETEEEEESGRLIIQEEEEAETVLQKLLYSYGIKLFPAADGRFTPDKKDITNFATNLIVFDQIDLLGPSRKEFGLTEVVNYTKAHYDYYPSAARYRHRTISTRAKSIEDFEATLEPKSSWLFPWTDSSTLITRRLQEELLKVSYGDAKLYLTLPISWLDDLDILTVFRVQDPYGLSGSGAGEVGHYYYIESLGIDLANNVIEICAIDLQWLLRQYFVYGDREALAPLWANASEFDKMYGYCCNRDTEKFANGELGKILIDRKYLGG